jgi:hypothetical protein
MPARSTLCRIGPAFGEIEIKELPCAQRHSEKTASTHGWAAARRISLL